MEDSARPTTTTIFIISGSVDITTKISKGIMRVSNKNDTTIYLLV
jgi:hypothetical protein